jgi:uncharacterized repeat protein (TIGR01451 family)
LYLIALSVAAMLVAAPTALAQTGGLSCGAFANQETAQAILDAHGDLYGHDLDGDGVACEDTGTGTAEDGTLAPFAQYAQYQYSGAPQTLAETGGPSLVMPVVAGTLVLGACIAGLFVVARRGPRIGDLLLGDGRQMAVGMGPNARRILVVVVAAALAALLAVVLGSGAVGPSKPASAQPANPLYLTTSVHPSPTNAIPIGTRMDFLITEQNVTAGGSSARNVTVTDELPAGVTYVGATPSQGTCSPGQMAPSTIICNLGTIPAGGVAHINIVVEASRQGSFTNPVYDSLGNQVSAGFTVVPRGTTISAGGASVRTCPGGGGAAVRAGSVSVNTGNC